MSGNTFGGKLPTKLDNALKEDGVEVEVLAYNLCAFNNFIGLIQQ